MQLYPHQDQGVYDIRCTLKRGVRRVLFVGFCGLGKTNMFCSMSLGSMKKGNSVWILVHRLELSDNTGKTLDRWGVDYGVIGAGEEFGGKPVQVVSVMTLASRLNRGWMPPRPPETIIVDEADLAAAETWQIIFRAFPKAVVIGFTATPCRMDGKGMRDMFDEMVFGPEPKWLMENDFLATPTYWGVPPSVLPDLSEVSMRGGEFNVAQLDKAMQKKPVITGDVLHHYKTRADGIPFIGFATGINEAERFATEFREKGVKCYAIHGDTERLPKGRLGDTQPTTRYGIKKCLEDGRIQGVMSVDIFGRGVDVPAVKCGLDMAPTCSLPKHIQKGGRVIRKDDRYPCVWIDFVGNLTREGLGTFEMEREYTLDGVVKKKKTAESLPAICQCPKCFAVFLRAESCPRCEYRFPIVERKIKAVAGNLKQLSASDIEQAQKRMKALREQGMTKDLESLAKVGRSRGMKDPEGWARHVIESREAKKAKEAIASQLLASGRKIG